MRIFPERDRNSLEMCVNPRSGYAKLAFLLQKASQILIIVVPVTAALLESQKVCQCSSISLDSETP